MPQTKGAKPSRTRVWLAYILFLILVIEVSLRVVFAVPQFDNLLTVNDRYSWQRQWMRRRQEAQHDIYYSFDRYHPTLGWISQPNLRDVAVFDQEFLNTNNRGLRGITDFVYEKDPETTRILVLGDSFTFRDEVSDDETYAHFLQGMLPGAEVINMGVHGYGHDQMLLLFLEEGIKYQPDIVLLGFLPADMERNVVAFRDYAKPRFLIRNDELVLTNSPVPTPDDVMTWDWIRPRTMDALSIITVGAKTKLGLRQVEEQEVTTRILDILGEAITFRGAVPIITYLPYGLEITSEEAMTPGERFLFSYCETNDEFYCFSTRPIFQ